MRDETCSSHVEMYVSALKLKHLGVHIEYHSWAFGNDIFSQLYDNISIFFF